MKKMTLLTLTVLTLTCIGGQTLTAHANTSCGKQLLSNGTKVYWAYSADCNINIQNILDRLESCFPGISLPDCEIPEVDVPEVEVPEVDVPDVEAPEVEAPEVDVPEVETPEIDVPENDVPENDVPDADVPDADVPDADVPGNGTTGDIPGESTPETTPENEHAFIRQVVNLVNAERAKEGLAPLTIDTRVQAAAMVRAKECEQLFSHTRPNGTSFSTALKEQNVSYRSAGENIAWGQRSPEEVMEAWMNSSGHRANIMNPNFTSIGVGYYQNANSTNYWCQLFTR